MKPSVICKDHERGVSQLTKALKTLCSHKLLTLAECDTVVRQYKEFVRASASETSFLKFSPTQDRLDSLLAEALSDKKEWELLWAVIKKLLLLSHGQASVERGFSMNKEMVSENQKEHSLIALRVVKDYLQHGGGVDNVQVTKELLLSASSARRKYQNYLDDEKAKAAAATHSKKRKADLEELQELKSKRRRDQESIASMVRSADEYALEAEVQGKLSLLTKSNALRQGAKERNQQLAKLDPDIAARETALKSL